MFQFACSVVVGITYPAVKERIPVVWLNVSPVVVEEIALRALPSVKYRLVPSGKSVVVELPSITPAVALKIPLSPVIVNPPNVGVDVVAMDCGSERIAPDPITAPAPPVTFI